MPAASPDMPAPMIIVSYMAAEGISDWGAESGNLQTKWLDQSLASARIIGTAGFTPFAWLGWQYNCHPNVLVFRPREITQGYLVRWVLV